MIVGESYRDGNRTMVWVKCPVCDDERGVKKKYSTESPTRLCKVCHLKRVKEVMSSMWIGDKYAKE